MFSFHSPKIEGPVTYFSLFESCMYRRTKSVYIYTIIEEVYKK